MNYHKIEKFSVANGTGIRVVLWVSGCSLHCKGCHNPETWNPDGGEEWDEQHLMLKILICHMMWIIGNKR